MALESIDPSGIGEGGGFQTHSRCGFALTKWKYTLGARFKDQMEGRKEGRKQSSNPSFPPEIPSRDPSRSGFNELAFEWGELSIN
jgi:hypothetical protein